MGSRLGRPNKDKQAVRDLAAAHGVDVIEMRILLLKDSWKTVENEFGKPRSRRSKQYFAAVAETDKHLAELTPYLHGKLSNVTVDNESSLRLMVIRAPEVVATSQAWLEKYGPKRDDVVNDRPTLPFVKNSRASLDTATAVGIDDAGEIVNEAIKQTKLDG